MDTVPAASPPTTPLLSEPASTPGHARSDNPSTRPFGTVLVANRGEIACRVIATLRRLGIRSVAVHSDADAGARHVSLADVAVRIGPAPAAESYLNVPAILDAARATGADAIHPGYGFLSENPELARACADAGIVFVGPGVAALEAMADKITAKEIVAARGVPVVPGSTGRDPGTGRALDDEALARAARDVGFPLLVKPSAGGGGKGMQVVTSADDLPAALASARRVATRSFGDGTLLVERLVARPRHIEVQVLADSRGAVVHLGERECSLQRRHQKVVEEAPSPLLDAATRERIGAAACEVARSVDYEGAGTVEFLVPAAEPTTFYFIEMNTRLQVEHPVTEMVTGLDLVEAQLRVAAGEPLRFAQEDVVLRGHAIEARVYAESPARGFLPATGEVLALTEPDGAGWRLDSSLTEGLRVGGDYDPLLAKAVAHGADRAQALDRLDRLLAETLVLGVDTNIGFLRALLGDPDVRSGDLDTGLIERFVAAGGVPSGTATEEDLAVVALFVLAGRPRGVPGAWGARDGWRLNASPRPHRVVLHVAPDDPHEVTVAGDVSDAVVHVDEGPRPGTARRAALTPAAGHAWRFTAEGRSETVHLATGADGSVWLSRAGRVVQVAVPTRTERLDAAARGRTVHPDGPTSPDVRAGMPGTVVAVSVADGESVDAGAVLVVVEAMKMEHALRAPHAGVVRLTARPGDLVRRDEVVARVERAPDDVAPVPADGPVAVVASDAAPAPDDLADPPGPSPMPRPEADIPAVPVPSHTPGAS
ncbi:biotin carboxylase N-terminal domain-containing protein [Oerskovia jenensis]|uniref:biotin carboxylase n=1 Tax=Oerskovia jenensis TaxID=162169 RepID=A0ABS2LGM5_9CELL|nr:biotin carboxylase N-terminal domain-containing protein [Oerskovia jenensis]MBM7479570.1 acetyl-CoA/propionyl-CoA carboxylase biotin carboxyl carrier protein [Oerskovia jenensis]